MMPTALCFVKQTDTWSPAVIVIDQTPVAGMLKRPIN
jgi:hypothetical protein